jgi:transposase
MRPRFVSCDRSIPLLFPPDLREWVRSDDPVHLVLALVESLPTTSFSVNEVGTGSRQYSPSMMLALLIHCYSKGIFSSRRIEEATYENVSVRYLTADTHPDHDTIASFRRKNREAIEACFVRALLYAKESGILKLGAISVDSTLLRANASKNRNVRYGDMDAIEALLAERVSHLLAKAEAADGETEDSDALPRALCDAAVLKEQIRTARAKIETRDRLQRERQGEKARRRRQGGSHDGEAALPENDTPPARGKGGPAPKKPPAPKAASRANLTDVDSRLMRKNTRSAYEQSYRAQAVADADGSQLILTTRVADAGVDNYELLPNVRGVPEALGRITAVLADSGYANQQHAEALEREGKDIYISVRCEAHHNHPLLPATPNPKGLSSIAQSAFGQKMRAKLKTEEGQAIYKRRRQSIEACFGLIKRALGFRQFHLRGLENVNLEWNLVALAYNIKMIGSAQRRKTKRRAPGNQTTAPRRTLSNAATQNFATIQSQPRAHRLKSA